jgi:hypothetical protein
MIVLAASDVIWGRMTTAPSSTPMFAPTGLNDCARLSRCVALCSGPIAMTNGLAEVSRIESPDASTKSATRKGTNSSRLLAGMNSRPPIEASPSPVSTPVL